MSNMLVGYCEMKKRKGKILFLEKTGLNGVVGVAAEKEFIFDDLADKVTAASIGRQVNLQFGRDYNGKAYVSDIVIE